jgi:hypothetical protein
LREVACHRAAAAAGVAPAVLDAAPDGSWILMDYVDGGMWTPPRLQAPEGLRTPGRLPPAPARDNAPEGPRDVRSGVLATGQAQAVLERDPAAAAQVNALVTRTRQLALDCVPDTNSEPLRSPGAPSRHIGETDSVAGHIGFELRCAK